MPTIKKTPETDPQYIAANAIRNTLAQQGFSEVVTYVFSKHKGEVEIANPSDKSKPYFRASLRPGIEEVLEKNAPNLPLLEGSDIRVFEIGNVYRDGAEYTELALGVWKPGKKADQYAQEIITQVLATLGEALGCDCSSYADINGTVGIVDVSKLLASERIDAKQQPAVPHGEPVSYKPFSPYPFVLRDIAVWTPEGTKPEEVLAIIKKHGGDLLVRSELFDTFEKDGRTSYAFNLVFQSHKRTLTDEEINDVMDATSAELNSKEGFEVR